jgi:hypothetical protein
MGHFQTRHPDSPWYRGRIAAVYSSSSPAAVACDVAYDDGDYERGVPLENVALLERGFERPAWLEGLTVPVPSKKRSGKGAATGTILKPEPNRPVPVRYRSGSEAWTESKAYRSVATERLFREAMGGKAVYDWPPPPPVVEATRSQTKKRGTSRRKAKKTASKPAPSEASTQKKTGTRRRKAAPSFDDDDDDEEEDLMDVDDEEESAQHTKKKAAPKKKKAAPQKEAAAKKSGAPPKKRMDLEEEDVPAVDESDAEFGGEQEAMPLDEPRGKLRRLNPTLATSLGRAVNSCDTELGFEWLTFCASFHGFGPNDALWKTLIGLLSTGPKSGSTTFSDVRRMNLANDFVALLCSRPDWLDDLSRVAAGADLARTFFRQMAAPWYAAAGDEGRTSGAAVGRVAHSLHAKAVFARLFVRVLEHQLRPFTFKKCRATDDGYREAPIVSGLLNSSSATLKHAFETAVAAYASLWIHCGHFLFGDLTALREAQNGPTGDSLETVVSCLEELLPSMGTAVSYMAWLYGREMREDARALADIIGRVFFRELERIEFDPSPFYGRRTEQEHFRRLRLDFLLGVDKRIVRNLRPRLAEKLAVARMYNAIFEI